MIRIFKKILIFISFLVIGITFFSVKPVIAKIINNDPENKFKLNVDYIIKEVQKQCYKSLNNEEKLISTYIFKDGISSEQINTKNDFFINGSIYVNSDCRIKVELTDGNYNANKNYSDPNVYISGNSTSDLIKNLKFYYFGDSLIEGYLNDYKGIAYYMEEKYNANTLKDYSISGAFLTSPIEKIKIKEQFSYMISRFEKISYDSNTVIVFDGGTNDFNNQYIYGITFEKNGNENTDFYLALGNIIDSLQKLQNDSNVKAPIIYMIPRLRNETDEYKKWIIDTKKYILSFNMDDLILLDLNEVLEEDDIHLDGIHINHSGYEKISTKIYEKLIDYYN